MNEEEYTEGDNNNDDDEEIISQRPFFLPLSYVKILELLSTQLDESMDVLVCYLLTDGLAKIAPLSYIINAQQSLKQAKMIMEQEEYNGIDEVFKTLKEVAGTEISIEKVETEVKNLLEILRKAKND
jgi:hypothetical protein